MDFALGNKAETVREEIRAFLAREYSAEDLAYERANGDGHNWALYKKLAADGWVSAGWPKEFGGGGRDPFEMLTLYWELSKAEFPWFGLLNNAFLGHTLMALGSEQQKAELVPQIAAGDIMISLGYTEPGSGSDVASARTQASRDGDDWIVNGQKMFTTTAHMSQYVFTLLRTDPEQSKHRGLTMLIVPTDAEGVTIHPVHTLGGERTNAVFFDNVRVSDTLRVGEVNEGWAVVRFALGLEQAMGYADRQEAFVEALDRWAAEEDASGQRPIDDTRVQERLAQTAINAEVAKLLRHRSTWSEANGLDTSVQGPMTKAFSAKTFLDDSRKWMDLLGPEAVLEHGASEAVAQGIFAETYRATPVTTIYGGTVEILRSMIAQVGLGLPRNR
jgi:alkylation response protein AidB-like acyl-CoA dehydrogenase